MAKGVDIRVYPGKGGGWASFGPKKRNGVGRKKSGVGTVPTPL